MEEFKDFKQYIKKIEYHGAHLKGGVAKIVAPEGWTPRPSKSCFSDVKSYEINQPVRETIEITEKPGTYFKRNETSHRKMKAGEFEKLAKSAKFRNPKPNLTGIDIEKYYFENILEGTPIYGADTEGSFYDEGIEEFNMNHLGTVLDDANSKIKGVNTVYLYFGMYKTTFPWHAEDMDLYSINFLHFGAPKYWFSISSEHADRFERFMSQQFSDQDGKAPKCKAFLRHKTFIVTPELLRAAKIPYATMIQRPNEFIITFPRGYHMGFNLDYNLAESTNFATDRWIDYGKDAVLCECNKSSVKIDMHCFMSQYRQHEVIPWVDYWYCPKDDKKGVAKKRKAQENRSPAKRSRLGVSSCSDSLESVAEVSSFMRSLPGYTMDRVEFRPDYDELLKLQNKKVSFELRSNNRVNFFLERRYNELRSVEWPHCSVCQYFQPIHMTTRNAELPVMSRRLIPSSVFSKTPELTDPEKEETDRLLTCSNCNVTVHSKCCSGDHPNENEQWRCLRCRNHTDVEIRLASCQLCQYRGGALIPCQIGKDSTWAHVECALFNRRTVFDRPIGPTACFVEPSPRQHSITASMPNIDEEYRNEYGDLYEHSRWNCVVCKRIGEGLVPCVHCHEEVENTAIAPIVAHVTCARRVGFVCELRDFPRGVVMICGNHKDSFRESKPETPVVKVNIGGQVFYEDKQSASDRKVYVPGTIITAESKNTVVVDFWDNSCSRDVLAEDIKSCECLHCENGAHQYGSRVNVLWDDGTVYACYFRGKSHVMEYTIDLGNDRQVKCSRDKIKTKRELNNFMNNRFIVPA
ncbi:hypothetical protein L3Y34_018805 [Caenorhabditis briggsae]|nr:hypothetical protein L3Y34_018805 [Caenorhabditis briggsae]